MELSEIKDWAEQHIPDYNMRTAFTLILEIIYGETDNRIEDIEKFYIWFLNKWGEVCDIIKGVYIHPWDTVLHANVSSASQTVFFYNHYVKDIFNLNKDFKEATKNITLPTYHCPVAAPDKKTGTLIEITPAYTPIVPFNFILN